VSAVNPRARFWLLNQDIIVYTHDQYARVVDRANTVLASEDAQREGFYLTIVDGWLPETEWDNRVVWRSARPKIPQPGLWDQFRVHSRTRDYVLPTYVHRDSRDNLATEKGALHVGDTVSVLCVLPASEGFPWKALVLTQTGLFCWVHEYDLETIQGPV
jgi:hypothetical protein